MAHEHGTEPEPVPRPFDGGTAFDAGNRVEDVASTACEVYHETLNGFKAELSPTQVDEFCRTNLSHVKQKLISIQKQKEQQKSMVGFSRMQLFLEKIGDFDHFCKQANIWGDDSSLLSAWIWGPALYILETSKDDYRALDHILDAYYTFGNRVPVIKHHEDLIKARPEVSKCLAYMYLDLLKFHKKAVKLLHGKGWKKTFESRWRDYRGEHKNTLANFEAHSEVLEIFSEAWKQQRTTDLIFQFNEHVGQTVDNTRCLQEILDRLPVFDAIERRMNEFLADIEKLRQSSDRNSSQGQEASLHSALWKDIHKKVNDQVIRSEDNRKFLDQNGRVLIRLVSMFDGLRQNMEAQFAQWESERKETQKRNVLNWISSPGMSQASQHSTFCLESAPNTGMWIFDDHKILSWMNAESPTESSIWLNGKMGAGKTILTSQIIQRCMERSPEFRTNYFYCRENGSQQSSSLAVLKGILWQMAGSNEELLPFCDAKRIEGRQEFLDQIKDAKVLLEAHCEFGTGQFVIIDGLDECKPGDRKVIVDFWRSMVEKASGKLRVLLVSQDLPDIRSAIEASSSTAVLDLLPSDTNRDIRVYLESRAPGIQARFRLDEAQIDRLMRLICERANGMFLYVSLTVGNLLQQPNKRCYNDELERDLPKDLANTYAKILEQLKSAHPNSWIVTRNILGWLAGAMRPLKWHELQAALSIQLDGGGAIIDRDWRLPEDIQEFNMCGPLVRIVREEDNMRLEFTHSTTRKHIRSNMQEEGLNAIVIDYDAAIKCLKYISMDCFSPNLDEACRQSYAQRGFYAMQDYVASEWGSHLQQLIATFRGPLLEGRSEEVIRLSQQIAPALQQFMSFYTEVQRRQSEVVTQELSNGMLTVPHSSSSQSSNSRHSPAGFSGSPSQHSGTFGNNTSGSGHPQPSLSSTSFPPSLSPSPVGSRSPDPTGDPVDFCSPFRCFPEVYKSLVQLWSHIENHGRNMDSKEREKLSLTQLHNALESTRRTIQSLSLEDDTATPNEITIAEMYGHKLYKCDRVRCAFFFEGFARADELEQHVNRHDRPYHCSVRNCTVAPFGFVNKKDCDRHVRNYHPNAAEEGLAFATGSTKASAEDIEARAKYACTFAGCNKKYTRKANLDAHLDTHNGTRRYKCRNCVKAFTRPSDRQRHEKLHMRGR